MADTYRVPIYRDPPALPSYVRTGDFRGFDFYSEPPPYPPPFVKEWERRLAPLVLRQDVRRGTQGGLG